jgi:hypothetical protein
MSRKSHLAGMVALVLIALVSPAQAQCADGDGDGICDDVDPCLNVDHVRIDHQFLRLRKVMGDASTRFYYVGQLVGLDAPAIDPIADGLRLVITVPATQERAAIETIDVTLPSGAYDREGGRGWTANSSGTFFYRDSHGMQLGIMRALLKRLESGTLKVMLFGQNGTFHLPLTVQPVVSGGDLFPLQDRIATAVVLDPAGAATEACGEDWLTGCRFRNRGRKLLCYP